MEKKDAFICQELEFVKCLEYNGFQYEINLEPMNVTLEYTFIQRSSKVKFGQEV